MTRHLFPAVAVTTLVVAGFGATAYGQAQGQLGYRGGYYDDENFEDDWFFDYYEVDPRPGMQARSEWDRWSEEGSFDDMRRGDFYARGDRPRGWSRFEDERGWGARGYARDADRDYDFDRGRQFGYNREFGRESDWNRNENPGRELGYDRDFDRRSRWDAGRGREMGYDRDFDRGFEWYDDRGRDMSFNRDVRGDTGRRPYYGGQGFNRGSNWDDTSRGPSDYDEGDRSEY